jgi:SNF2 family DNA or RNA helicase
MKAILQPILLRRTKDLRVDGKPILSLPSCQVNEHVIPFASEEEVFYQGLWDGAKSQFLSFLKEGSAEVTLKGYYLFFQQNYLSILETLLRVRQACDHPYLVLLGNQKDKSSTDAELLNKEFDRIVKEMKSFSGADGSKEAKQNNTNKMEELKTSKMEDCCSSCSDELDDTLFVSGCPHKLCRSVSCSFSEFNLDQQVH